MKTLFVMHFFCLSLFSDKLQNKMNLNEKSISQYTKIIPLITFIYDCLHKYFINVCVCVCVCVGVYKL